MTTDDFVEKLANYVPSDDTVFNMYRGDSEAAAKCRENLRKYLEERRGAWVLLIGEALGYNGAAKTGVPFTSETDEPSSKVIWEFFDTEYPDDSSFVLMWNAFPFHPHEDGNLKSNRKPKASELEIGREFLEMLLEVFPEIICVGVIGRTAEKALSHMDLKYSPAHIRHPAHGGKKECLEGLREAFSRFQSIKNVKLEH